MEYAHYGQRGEVSVAADDWVAAESHCAFPAYFATLGTPVLQGREFRTREGNAIVISQMLSLRMFGTESSIGRTLREKRKGKTTDREVVGVVRDMKYGSPREQTEPAFYLPCLQEWTPKQAGSRGMSIAVRGVDAGLERAARREVDALGRQVVFRATPLRDLVGLRMLNERMFAVVTSAYGLVTLMVVGVGLYGLMIFLVASRRREIGIRVAVGAQRSDVLWVVLRAPRCRTSRSPRPAPAHRPRPCTPRWSRRPPAPGCPRPPRTRTRTSPRPGSWTAEASAANTGLGQLKTGVGSLVTGLQQLATGAGAAGRRPGARADRRQGPERGRAPGQGRRAGAVRRDQPDPRGPGQPDRRPAHDPTPVSRT